MKSSIILSICSGMVATALALPQSGVGLKAPIEGYEVQPLPDGDAANLLHERAGNPNCDIGGSGPATRSAIEEGVRFLTVTQAAASCGIDNGPRVCSRVSCSYNSAIWICNDNDGPLSIGCGELGRVAGEILARCPAARSQLFSSGNWNVIVGRDSC